MSNLDLSNNSKSKTDENKQTGRIVNDSDSQKSDIEKSNVSEKTDPDNSKDSKKCNETNEVEKTQQEENIEETEKTKRENSEKDIENKKASESPFLSNITKPLVENNESNKKEEEKGSEIFRGYSILYRYMADKNELKERGIGDLVIELFES